MGGIGYGEGGDTDVADGDAGDAAAQYTVVVVVVTAVFTVMW